MSNVPRWRWMIPYAMASPRPVPRSPLVVKKGSRQRRRTSSVIPAPVSVTVTSTGVRSASAVVAMRSVPPCGMASTALKIRFISTSRSSETFPSMDSTVARSASMWMETPAACACAFQHGQGSVELIRVDRLGREVVRARFHRLEVALLPFQRGQQDDVGVPRAVLGADSTTQLEAVEVRHHPVGDDERHVILLENRPGLLTVRHRHDFMAEAGQALVANDPR